jgi:hypothetical protein
MDQASACRVFDGNNSCAQPANPTVYKPPASGDWVWRGYWRSAPDGIITFGAARAPDSEVGVPLTGKPVIASVKHVYYTHKLNSGTHTRSKFWVGPTRIYSPPHYWRAYGQPGTGGQSEPYESWPLTHHLRSMDIPTGEEWDGDDVRYVVSAVENWEGWEVCQGAIAGTPCADIAGLTGGYMFSDDDCEAADQADPLNVVFYGPGADEATVMEHLEAHTSWGDTGLEGTMSATVSSGCVDHGDSLASAAGNRQHVRIWYGGDANGAIDDWTIGGVHDEVVCELPAVGHRVLDFDGVRDDLAATFAGVGPSHGHVSLFDLWGNSDPAPQGCAPEEEWPASDGFVRWIRVAP